MRTNLAILLAGILVAGCSTVTGDSTKGELSAQGFTPLLYAAREGDALAVEREIAAGANVNQRLKNGVTALMLASIKGHRDIVRALLTASADVNASNKGTTALHVAAHQGHGSVIRDLLAAGARVDARTDAGYLRSTPLLDAAGAGQLDAAEILMNAGADVNARDELGLTPLMLAAAGGYGDLVSLLLQHGAKAEVEFKDGTTALDFAEQEGHAGVAEVLRRAGKP